MAEDNLGITLSDNCYRLLLILYPRPFRREYGREMGLVFRDTCRRVDRREGTAGLIELWLVTLADLLTTALKERLTEVTDMSNELFTRLCGFVAAAGGLLIVVMGIAGMVDQSLMQAETSPLPLDFFVVFYGIAWAVGLAGYYNLRSYDTLGRIGLGLGFIGALLISAGGVAMLSLGNENGWSAWFGGSVLNLVGLTLFGVSLLRSRALPQGNLVPLLAGIVPLALSLLTLNIESAGWGALPLLLAGFSWLALGVLLVRLAGESMEPLAPAV